MPPPHDLTLAKQAPKLLGNITDALEKLTAIGYLNAKQCGLIENVLFKTDDAVDVINSLDAKDEGYKLTFMRTPSRSPPCTPVSRVKSESPGPENSLQTKLQSPIFATPKEQKDTPTATAPVSTSHTPPASPNPIQTLEATSLVFDTAKLAVTTPTPTAKLVKTVETLLSPTFVTSKTPTNATSDEDKKNIFKQKMMERGIEVAESSTSPTAVGAEQEVKDTAVIHTESVIEKEDVIDEQNVEDAEVIEPESTIAAEVNGVTETPKEELVIAQPNAADEDEVAVVIKTPKEETIIVQPHQAGDDKDVVVSKEGIIIAQSMPASEGQDVADTEAPKKEYNIAQTKPGTEENTEVIRPRSQSPTASVSGFPVIYRPFDRDAYGKPGSKSDPKLKRMANSKNGTSRSSSLDSKASWDTVKSIGSKGLLANTKPDPVEEMARIREENRKKTPYFNFDIKALDRAFADERERNLAALPPYDPDVTMYKETYYPCMIVNGERKGGEDNRGPAEKRNVKGKDLELSVEKDGAAVEPIVSPSEESKVAAESEDEEDCTEPKKPAKYFGLEIFHEEGHVLGSNAAPLGPNNRGRQMLQKMGHVNGTGLGSNGTGILVPLEATMQNGRAGVGMFSAMNEPPVPSFTSAGTVSDWDMLYRNPPVSVDLFNKENQDPKHVADLNSGNGAKTQTQHLKDVTVSTAGSCTNAEVSSPQNAATPTAGRGTHVESQSPKSVSAPTVRTKPVAQNSTDEGAQKITAPSDGNVSDVRTQPLMNNPAPTSSAAPQKTHLFNKCQMVRFISEGPPSNFTFTFPKSTTGGRDALLGPTNHYRGTIVQAYEQRLGNDYGFLPIEVGDRFEVLSHAYGYRFLVKRAFGDCKRGFINIYKVEMTPDQHRAAASTKAPASTSVTGANSATSRS